ncbi:HNH endonuclease domain-containing protein [Mycobacterium avium subsp. hominissuis]|uniref:HNH endonuclease n=1 Tax=Mycobacterium avium TaxID=1764 RepID=UPI0009BFA345|nr:HNH endonuclease signature motif containing protein [Mycobacterium avium]MBZ4508539.1 HNH endonuclease [Mycobacterium avium subsp. hominissuis]MBZ4547417.1 HNH endonuclease [Mycobacterium avium subsp. hominissuis]MBZ4566742.1 HNH endonuclease [Mycobacterium avium subsp. hominissuis]
MLEKSPIDPLLLGQRVVVILETGRRTATYKLAVLVALIDYSVEHLPETSTASIDVPLNDLADRIIEMYWRQVVPFEGTTHRLYQSTGEKSGDRALILDEITQLRGAPDKHPRRTPAMARQQVPMEYEQARGRIVRVLVRQPLYRLQKSSGTDNDDVFLYDDSWMNAKIGNREIGKHGNKIQLKPGVATGLARLAGLLKPTIRIHWAEAVRAINPTINQEVPPVERYLFGTDRVALARAGNALKDAFSKLCFYCNKRVATAVDHVLPWSRLGLDSLANLVPVCAPCNGSKLNAVPAVEHLVAALCRDRTKLEEIAARLHWPAEFSRVILAARGIYLSTPEQSPTWFSIGKSVPFEFSALPEWIRWPKPDQQTE